MTKPDLAPGDYVLGADAAELARLRIQHDVWRAHVHAAWDAAGIGLGQRVIDLGAGPGHAAVELAARVGSGGEIVAIERAPEFVAHLAARAQAEGLPQLRVVQGDVTTLDLGYARADAIWVRWLLCFLHDPLAVLARAVAALRPGGVIVLHEYVAYDSWRMLPPSAALGQFVGMVMQSWRDTGSEPNVAARIPAALESLGLTVTCTPIVGEGNASSDWWRWPAGFIRGNLPRLAEIGHIAPDEAARLGAVLEADLARPGARMLGPVVLQVIARKP